MEGRRHELGGGCEGAPADTAEEQGETGFQASLIDWEEMADFAGYLTGGRCTAGVSYFLKMPN